MDAAALARLLELAQSNPAAFDALLAAAQETTAPAAPGMSVRELWAKYDEYARESLPSWPQNQASCKAHLLGFFGDYRWDQVSHALVREYRKLRRGQLAKKTGKPISPATRNKEVRCLKSMFSWAVRERELPCKESPLRGLEDERETDNRDFHVVEEDFVRLLHHCRPLLRSMLALAFETGMRRDEYRCLEWAEVDLDNTLITLPPDRHKAGHRSRQPRYIPLSSIAVETLKRQARTTRYVFPNARGVPVPKTTLWDWFHEARTLARLKGPRDQDVWLHSMRKSFGSLAGFGGMPIEMTMDIAGWKDKATADKYRSQSRAHVQAARAHLDARLQAPEKILAALDADRLPPQPVLAVVRGRKIQP